MTKLPRISGRECVTALQRAGYRVRRQTGSHVVMQRDEPYTMVVVPNHRELDRGTLHNIVRKAELTVEEFLDLLE